MSKKCFFCKKSYVQGKKYCSKKCYWNYLRAKENEWKKIRKCLICNKEFLPIYPKTKYCSIKCFYYTYYKSQLIWKKPLKCKTCNNDFIPKNRKQQFCNIKCSANYKLKKRAVGDKNGHWKGGISFGNSYERIKFKKLIRKDVLKRDNYTCQICGKKGGRLQVDHIQKWADYIKLRFSMDNCRTLCVKCHYKITFGKSMPENNNWTTNRISKLLKYRRLD